MIVEEFDTWAVSFDCLMCAPEISQKSLDSAHHHGQVASEGISVVDALELFEGKMVISIGINSNF